MTSVNLLAPELRPVDRERTDWSAHAGGLLVIAALALAILAAALYALAANGVDRRQATLDTATAQAQAVTAQAAQLAPYTAFATMVKQRVETVRQIGQSRFPWDRTLDDVSRVIPSQAHLTGITASKGATTGGTGTATGTIPSLQLEGCIDTQRRIPDLLSRLSEVRGVTRVALAKSESADDPAAKAADASTTGDVPCTDADAPVFDVTVYFGTWTSPLDGAATTTGTAAPAATATPAAGATG